METNVGVITV